MSYQKRSYSLVEKMLDIKSIRNKEEIEKNKRILRTEFNYPYELPQIIQEEQKELKFSQNPKSFLPIYLDSKGNVYNLYFEKLDLKEIFASFENEKSKFNHKIIKNFPKLNRPSPKFPDDLNFKDFSDFETALINWKKDMLTYIGFAKIPKIIGRAYERPQVDLKKVLDQTSEQQRKIEKKMKTQSVSIKHFPSLLSPKPKVQFRETISEIIDFHLPTNFTKISWDQELIPEEPDPENYKTFEEFEIAFQKWSQIIMNTTSLIPPHAINFVDMFGLITNKEKQRREFQTKEKEKKRRLKEKLSENNETITHPNLYLNWILKVNQFVVLNSLNIQDFEKKIFSKSNFVELKENDDQNKFEINNFHRQESEKIVLLKKTQSMMRIIPTKEEFEENQKTEKEEKEIEDFEPKQNLLNGNTIDQINQFIDSVISLQNRNLTKYQQFHSAILGICHGFFSKSSKDQQNKFDNFNQYLRRKDISMKLINESVDSPDNIVGKEVTFAIPKYELSTPFTIKELQTNQKSLRNEVINLDKEHNENNLMAWNHPVSLPTELAKFQELILKLESFDLDIFLKFFTQFIYLDRFEQLLWEKKMYLNNKSVMEYIAQCFTSENFKELLKLLNYSPSILFQSKVSLFIKIFFLFPKSIEIFKTYLDSYQMEEIYHITFAFNFLAKNSFQLFPCVHVFQNFDLVKSNIKYSILERDIFFHYYLKILYQLIQSQRRYSFDSISRILKEKVNYLDASIQTGIDMNKDYFDHVFKFICSNSIHNSAYYLFILMQLLEIESQTFLGQLQSESIGLFQKLTNPQNSKFTTVKLAYHQIWKKLLTLPNWKFFLLSQYSKRTQLLISELKSIIENNNKNNSSLIVELIKCYLKNILESSDQKNETEINISIPLKIFELLKESISVKRKKNGITEIAEILSLFIKLFMKQKLIHFESIVNKKSKKENKWIVTTQFLQEMINLTTEKYEKDEIKTFLFASIRFILRTNQSSNPNLIFPNQENFYSSIISSIQENKKVTIAQQMWGVFTDCVIYQPGSISFFIQNDLFKSLFETLSPLNYINSIYAMKTMVKIMNLVSKESERISQNKFPRRSQKNSLQSFQKDQKIFYRFMEKNLLILKIHLIYTECFLKNKEGQLFTNLGHVYEGFFKSKKMVKLMKNGPNKHMFEEEILLMSRVLGYDNLGKNNQKQKRKKHQKSKQK
ncbi:sca1 complex scaffold protein scaa [Anaeramoeba ignava]|uniref:Sca1 complex scaffold protein scaa n=1 Tax=Anaeramoeba ignava TaxID=1746090 RepID=A0A9Q0R6Y9_ANAIG|nr:sca1 complex scaffold protein scaa [Anaeramoeba ignava]